VELVAWALAVALGGFWVTVRGLAWASERRSLAAFRQLGHSVTTAAAPPTSAGAAAIQIDQSLWDAGRVRAYVRALNRASPPPLAVLRIPRLRFEAPVLEGTDEWTLDRGVGHIEGTPPPGRAGNVGLAGHRDGFFRVLKDVAEGDVLVLELPGEVRHYRVVRLTIVGPDDVRVLAPTPGPRLTLVTCYPFYFVGAAPRRFIVEATPD
jgi:sortase A